MIDDPRVDQLLEELLESGGSPEEVCRSCPELLPQVRSGLQRLRMLDHEVDALFPPSDPLGGVGTAALPTAELPCIPGYEVQGELGRGGVGVVYRAWHRRLNRPVALKMLLAGPYARPEELERFFREAETVAGLRHPNIVQLYDAGDLHDRPYYTMEFVEGGNLAQKIAGVPQPAREAAALLATVAEAVDVAHRSGIVHRDLTPANILLTTDGTPKVSDFGLARRLEGGGGLTLSGVPLGTPSYMAPEQAQGRKEAIGPATDVYALGAILYEMLTGRPPFRSESPTATLQQVLHEDPVPPSRLNGKVPRDLETVCLKCLHKEPRSRYPSAAALAQDLHRFLRGEAIMARPEGVFSRFSRRIRRQPALSAAVALATLLTVTLIGCGVWMLSERAAAARGVQATEKAADDDLKEMAALLKKSSWPEARAAMERAKGRLGNIHSVDLRRRLDQGARDLDLVADLEAIRLGLSSRGDGHGAESDTAESLYDRAFRKYGIEVMVLDPARAAARIRHSAIRETLLAFLHDWLYWISEVNRARVRAVVDLADDDPWRRAFRDLIADRGKEQAKIQALALAPEAVEQPTVILSGLGGALLANNQRDAARTLLTEAQRRHPDDFWINFLLGHFWDQERPQQAVGFFRAAVALRPSGDQAYFMLAKALRDSGDADAALAAFKEAIALNPERVSIKDLAKILAPRGRLEELRLIWEELLERDPAEYTPWYGYAQLCLFLGNEGEYRRVCKALLDRFENSDDWTVAERTSLACMLLPTSGNELRRAVDLADRAVAAGEKDSGPDNAYLWFLEGLAEYRLGRPERAIPLLQASARKLPDRAGPGLVLAMAQFRSGSTKQARKTLAAAIRRYRWDRSWADHTSGWISHVLRREAERMLLPKLPAFLNGTHQPRDNDERLALIGVCQFEGRWSTAARLYAEAFEADPKLAEDPYAQGHYKAACFAALAGSGRGDDETTAGDLERARWRRQARDWLRADLASIKKLLDSDGPVSRQDLQRTLASWAADPDLAGLRDPAELDRLSPAERQECRDLWRDHDALLERAVDSK